MKRTDKPKKGYHPVRRVPARIFAEDLPEAEPDTSPESKQQPPVDPSFNIYQNVAFPEIFSPPLFRVTNHKKRRIQILNFLLIRFMENIEFGPV